MMKRYVTLLLMAFAVTSQAKNAPQKRVILTRPKAHQLHTSKGRIVQNPTKLQTSKQKIVRVLKINQKKKAVVPQRVIKQQKISTRQRVQPQKSSTPFLQALITNPLHVLKMINTRKKDCPLLLLGECEGGDCVLSRAHNPQFRKAFEKRAVTELLAKSGPIQYVSFGCGGLFQDIVILAKALSQRPNAHITVHLIDRKCRIYTTCKNVLGKSREVLANRPTYLKSAMPAITKQIKKEDLLGDSDNKRLATKIQNIVAMNEALFIQFLSFLQKHFPRAKLSLHIHHDADTYLSYRKDHKMPPADCITGADLESPANGYMYLASIEEYFKLCERALKDNPASRNVLFFGGWTTGVGLATHYEKSKIKRLLSLKGAYDQHVTMIWNGREQ